ncbi:MAG: oligosaccharide flippase family protein [Methanoregulaceae archaeon]
MSDLKAEIQRHGLMYLFSSMGITMVGFFATMFYAHWVGAKVLGIYFLFLSVFNILCVFMDLGVNYASINLMCRGKDTDSYFSANLVIHLVLFGITVAGLLLFHEYFSVIQTTDLLLLLIIAAGLMTLLSITSVAISASNRLGLAASLTFLNNVTRIGFQVVAVFLGFQVYGLIGGLIAGLLLQALIELKYIDYHVRKFDFSQVKQIFSYSNWAFLATTGTVLFDNLNPLIIGYFMSFSDVGVFGVCWTFSFFALFVSTALCNSLYVKVSRWHSSGDRNAIALSLSRATTYSMIFAIPILVGSLFLGSQLLYYLYGASFMIGATALVIIIGMRVVQSVLQLYSNFLLATDHARQAVYGVASGIVVNIMLTITLVPLIGLSGAAVASLANIIINTAVAYKYLGGVIPISIETKPLKHIALATGVMMIPLFLINLITVSHNLFQTAMMVLGGAVIYFVVLLLIDHQLRNDALMITKIRWWS